MTVLLFAGVSVSLQAGTFSIYGPKIYERAKGAPVVELDSFTVKNSNIPFTLKIYNGEYENIIYDRVSSATVSVNGISVVAPAELNQQIPYIEKPLVLNQGLNAHNQIAVEVASRPGSALVIMAIGHDDNPPTIQTHINPVANADGWHKQDLQVSFTCDDAESGIATCPDPVTVSREAANQSISGTATDLAGNKATATVSINLDKTAPQISGNISPAANQHGWHNSDVNITYTCTDSLSGIKTCPTAYTFTNEGQDQQHQVSTTDKAGNNSQISHTVHIDKTAPQIQAQLSATNANGWHNSDVTVSFICTDTGSGIATCPDPITLTTEGANQNISGTATDKAGNQASTSISINLDKTAPSISATATPTANNDGWNNTDVTVTFDCNDSGSGVQSCQTPISLSTEGGNQNITGTAIDQAGNTAHTSISLNIDKTQPAISVSQTPAANANGWNNTDVNVSFDCSDSGSGIKECSAPINVSAEGEGQLITGETEDKAGNSNSTHVTVNIDKTPPQLNITSPANGVTVQDTSIQISGSVSDNFMLQSLSINGSNVDENPDGSFSYELALIEGSNIITVIATDAAGNTTEQVRSVEHVLYVDDTPPNINAVTLPGPNSHGWNNTNVIVRFDCSDDESGIASCTDPVTVEQDGSNQVVNGSATDNAGHQANTSVTLNIDKTAPVINLAAHAWLNGENIAAPNAVIEGQVSDNNTVVTLRINGKDINIQQAANSSFSYKVDLNPGLNSFELVLTDIAGNQSSRFVDINRAGNEAPQIVSNPVTYAVLERLYQYQVVATDPNLERDGDSLSYSLDAAPAGMIIDPASGMISWNPSTGDQGDHSVSVRVTDKGGLFATQDYQLSASSNDAPQITSVPDLSVKEYESYTYDINAFDPNGDALNYSNSVPRADINVDPNSGELLWSGTNTVAAESVEQGDGQCIAPKPDNTPWMDLSNWQVATTLPPDPLQWQLQPGNQEVMLLGNPNPTMFVSNTWLEDGAFEFNLRAEGGDNDAIGFVWGYRDAQHFYFFYWTEDKERLLIGKVDSETRLYRLKPFTSLYYVTNTLAWERFVDYRVILDVKPGRFTIVIKQGNKILHTINIDDDTYVGGLVGFFNSSQSHTFYKARPIPRGQVSDLRVGNVQVNSNSSSDTVSAKVSNLGLVPSDTTVSAHLYGTSSTDHTVKRLLGVKPLASMAGSSNLDLSFDPVAVSSLVGIDQYRVEVDTDHVLTECTENNNTASAAIMSVGVSDPSDLSDTQRYSVRVENVNDAPSIISTPKRYAIIGEGYTYTIKVSDKDAGDKHRYELLSGPGGMQFFGEAGTLIWAPSTADLEQAQEVVVRVYDLAGAYDEQSFTIESNQRPQITSQPQNPPMYRKFEYQLEATDPDGDALTYTMLKGQNDVFLDANGFIISRYQIWPANKLDLVVQASDGKGGTDIQRIYVVGGYNSAPVITTTPVLSARIYQAYVYDVNANDGNGDTLYYYLRQGPAGMRVDELTGVVRWIPAAVQYGRYEVQVDVVDLRGGVATQKYQVSTELLFGNQAPQIVSIPTNAAETGSHYQYDVQASDPDLDTLIYSLTQAPTGMVIDIYTGQISWIPANHQAGIHRIAVEVSDRKGGFATQEYDLAVNAPPNNAPTITSTPDTIATVGQDYSYAIDASDPDEDNVSYSLDIAPSGLILDTLKAEITWSPTAADIGSHDVSIIVSDGRGGSVTQSYVLVVQNPEPPSFSSSPVFTAKAGYLYSYQVGVDHVNSAPLSYSLLSAPMGMSISNTGLVTWTPTPAQIGQHSISLQASDGGYHIQQNWTLTVLDNSLALSASVVINPTSVNQGDTVTIVLNAENMAGDISRSLSVDGQDQTLSINPDGSASATIAAQGIGKHSVTASVTDVTGTAQAQGHFYVKDPNDTSAPDVLISTPAHDSTITAIADIRGSVSETNLDRYVLAYAPAGSDQYITLAQGTSAFAEQSLAQLDTTQMRNGLYNIVLQAWDASGNSASDSVQILVDGQMKVGNFSFTVVDLEVPLTGIPIRVTRTYDSRRRNEYLDFGYGWSLGYQDLKLEESRTPGQMWTLKEYPMDPYGALVQFCVEPLGNNRVVVTLPDGRVEQFKVKATPSCQLGAPALDVYMSFEPEPGTLSTLKHANEQLLRLVDGHLVELGVGTPFDPDHYQLTTKEGFVYNIEQGVGINTITDPNGNTITYTDNGIFHSDGPSISFNRDASGRILSVTDPAGNNRSYDYDASSGDLISATDFELHSTTYDYVDANLFPSLAHALSDINDPLGRGVVKNIYDSSDVNKGRLIAQIDADGNRTEFNHDIQGRESVITNRRGYITRYFYDERGNVTVKVDNDGATVYEYDTDDNLLSTMNPLGEMSYGTYDDRRNQLTQTDGLGNTVKFSYNLRGQELTVTDARDNNFENEYDTAGNLLFVTDPKGNVAQQFIGGKGLVRWRKDALGHYTYFDYDDNGRTISESDAVGGNTTYTYDANGNVKTETRKRNVDGIDIFETTTYEYDKLNRLVQTTDALNNISKVEYDAVGNESARVDAKGRRTEFEYDAYRRLIKTTYADGTFETQDYDAEGNLIRSTDPEGHVTRYRYDAMNRQIEVIQADNSVTKTEYDAAGRVITATDARGNITTHEYDAAGRRIKTIDALLNETTFEYDADGNLIKQTDANGHTVSYDYDELDRRVKTTFHDGSFTEQAYDAMGRQTRKTDQSAIATQYGYDAMGRLKTVTDALGQITSYGYDKVGNKLSQTDANNHTTRWTYDALGRVESRTLPMGQVERFTYDANGNVKTRTDFNQNTTTYVYDNRDRLQSISYHDGSVESFTYTDSGQRASVTDARGTTTYIYDNMNRLKSETQPDGTVSNTELGYDYDAAGNRTLMQTQVTDSGNVTTTTATSYTFDVLNRLDTVTDHNQQVTTYGYDAVGNRASVAYANGTTTRYRYDGLNRLENIQTRDSSNSVISEFSYTLYPTGHRQMITDHNGTVSSYVYDDLYRLSQETINHANLGTVVNNYDYDPVGNRLSSTENSVIAGYSYDANDRLSSKTQSGVTTTYTYDDNGNQISITEDAKVTTNGYDARNKLISVEVTASDLPISNLSFQYDADGNRVSKTRDGSQTKFVVDKNQSYAQVIHETDPNNQTQVTYTFGDDLISQDRSANINYYNYDGLGSTRSLTDSLGQVIDTYDYNAYGTVLNQSGSSENSYLFTGEQYDSATKQYYLRARYYDPANGRFWQMDTYQGRPGEPVSLHKYLYADANPINGIDPSGNVTLQDLTFGTNGMAQLGGRAIGSNSVRLLVRRAVRGAIQSVRQTGKLAIRTARQCIRKSNKCKIGIPMLIVGADNIAMAQHIYDAQMGRGSNSIGGSLMLTYKRSSRRATKSQRQWYSKTPECNGYARARAAIKYNTSLVDCDEYPMFSTYEGGPYNYPIRTSLRPLPQSQNRSVGALSAWLYKSFKYKNRKKFLVIASPSIPISAWVPEK